MSLSPYVERITEATQGIQAAKAAIASAITAKGGTVGASDGLADFSSAIAAIPSGGVLPPQIVSITAHDYVQSEDWLSDAKGNGLHVADTYMPYVSGENHVYIIKCTNNTAPENYNFSGGVCARLVQNSGAYGASYRASYSSGNSGWSTERSLYISAGANISVIDIKLEVTA